jgi:hypothetical protein
VHQNDILRQTDIGHRNTTIVFALIFLLPFPSSCQAMSRFMTIVDDSAEESIFAAFFSSSLQLRQAQDYRGCLFSGNGLAGRQN